LLQNEHRVIASVTPYATEYVRLGPSLANTDADVEKALRAVRDLA
jgi:selenocysteine lyase/cysteine desulfurase